MKTALTIAGSDSSGGAGIQADLKSFAANGVFGMSVINSVTSQNTTGVFGVYDIPCDVVASQIDAVFKDIFPDAVKIGMVSSAEIISTIADRLKYYNTKNIVLDTVMVSTSGCKLLRDDAIDALTSVLFPIADIITPNLHEAQILCGFDIRSESDMVRAADVIYNKYNVTVLLKGGHPLQIQATTYCMTETKLGLRLSELITQILTAQAVLCHQPLPLILQKVWI